jgi:hypothetical protein
MLERGEWKDRVCRRVDGGRTPPLVAWKGCWIPPSCHRSRAHRAIIVPVVVLDSPSLFPTIFAPWMGDWEEARSSAASHFLSSTVVAACTRTVTDMTRGAAVVAAAAAVASSPHRHAPPIHWPTLSAINIFGSWVGVQGCSACGCICLRDPAGGASPRASPLSGTSQSCKRWPVHRRCLPACVVQASGAVTRVLATSRDRMKCTFSKTVSGRCARML